MTIFCWTLTYFAMIDCYGTPLVGSDDLVLPHVHWGEEIVSTSHVNVLKRYLTSDLVAAQRLHASKKLSDVAQVHNFIFAQQIWKLLQQQVWQHVRLLLKIGLFGFR